MVLGALEDFMLRLLIGCAIISMAVEIGFNINEPEKLATAWIEGFAILVAVAVVSLVGAWSDYKKEGQFLEQQKLEEKSKIVSLFISQTVSFSKINHNLNLIRCKPSEIRKKSPFTGTTSRWETSSRSEEE